MFDLNTNERKKWKTKFRIHSHIVVKCNWKLDGAILTSGVHFSGIFSNESGESTEKHIKMTFVSG